MKTPLNIAAIETFYQGAHKIFIDGLKHHSHHHITLITLPPQSWRTLMQNSATEILQTNPNLAKYDLLFVTNFINIAELKALIGPHCPPIILYVHENQHTYPRSPHQQRDTQVEWIDFINTITADQVIYNSDFHRTSYHHALTPYLQHLTHTTLTPTYWLHRAQTRSHTLYPGTDTPQNLPPHTTTNTPPRIVWNHRWEYDKQPTLFLNTLIQIQQAGYDFDLLLFGETPPGSEYTYTPLINQLKDHILHQGYIKNRNDYFTLLTTGDIVISTAIQENFGLAIIEAIQCGCFPLLPNRLSYPELIPKEHHSQVLYPTDEKLYDSLTTVLEHKHYTQNTLSQKLMKYQWDHRIAAYDDLFTNMVITKNKK